MPIRTHAESEPVAINHVDGGYGMDSLEIATRNLNKLREFERNLPGIDIKGVDLKVPEIQDLDPRAVVIQKAKDAWEANGYNPIVVEDTSLSLLGVNGLPGTYADAFTSTEDQRRRIAKNWLADTTDRRAVARVYIAVYDGKEVHIREGVTTGTIPEDLRGSNGFGWDDMFIPDSQPDGETRTFAEMTGEEKDQYSMRRKAIEDLRDNPFQLGYQVWELPEPFAQEMERLRLEELLDENARAFAFALEPIEGINDPNAEFHAPHYKPIQEQDDHTYFTRYTANPESASLGLVITDIERSNIKLQKNGKPILWQMGPERRRLALAQRAEYFKQNQKDEVYELIDQIERGEVTVPERSNRRHHAVDKILGIKKREEILLKAKFKAKSLWAKLRGKEQPSEDEFYEAATDAAALSEIGYRKRSTEDRVSRGSIAENGLFTKIGKYPRRFFGLGSMPQVAGQRDVIVTAAVGHMPIFATRNNLFAEDIDRQIQLINESKEVIQKLPIPEERKHIVERNIGASIGVGNPQEELEKAKRLYHEAGVKLFRLYTIGSDSRVVETARLLRQEFGDDIEIFVGQIADKNLALQLAAEDIRVDALIYGHGGGRQCTSATNGMAISTMEEIYEATREKKLNKTTILVEGGVGKNMAMLALVDGILYNQQLVHGTIEAGDVFLEHEDGSIVQPYPGEASAPTQIIEARNEALRSSRMRPSGRNARVEGKPGFWEYEEKANSMSFWIWEFMSHGARELADLGVHNMREFRELINNPNEDILRIVSPEAAKVAGAYRRGR